MKEAYHLGVRDFAENRVEAALLKMPQLPSDITWHFIGPIQSKKAAKIVQSFEFIHSIASLKTAELVAAWGEKLDKRPGLFLQVNTSGEKSKQGFTEEELLVSFSACSSLNIVGLMTMAPLTEDQEVIRSCFHRLACLGNNLKLPHLSMGMSHDFPIAIEEGATFLRIGSYLFQ